MQGVWVQSLVRELDLTCFTSDLGEPLRHNPIQKEYSHLIDINFPVLENCEFKIEIM